MNATIASKQAQRRQAQEQRTETQRKTATGCRMSGGTGRLVGSRVWAGRPRCAGTVFSTVQGCCRDRADRTRRSGPDPHDPQLRPQRAKPSPRRWDLDGRCCQGGDAGDCRFSPRPTGASTTSLMSIRPGDLHVHHARWVEPASPDRQRPSSSPPVAPTRSCPSLTAGQISSMRPAVYLGV